jgi:hypothetical protein
MSANAVEMTKWIVGGCVVIAAMYLWCRTFFWE